MQRDPCVEDTSPMINASAKPLRSMRLAPLRVLADTQALASVVGRELLASRRFSRRLAVLIVRLNATAEPALMLAMGERLRGRLRAGDLAFQLGEDGFGVLLLGAAAALTIQRRLLKALSGPYGVDGQLLNVSLRIGVAENPAADVSGAALVLGAEPTD